MEDGIDRARTEVWNPALIIAENLERLAAARGVALKDVLRSLGMTLSMNTYIRKGGRAYIPEQLEDLANYFSVSVSDLETYGLKIMPRFPVSEQPVIVMNLAYLASAARVKLGVILRECGMHHSRNGRVRTGANVYSEQELESLAKRFGVSVGDLNDPALTVHPVSFVAADIEPSVAETEPGKVGKVGRVSVSECNARVVLILQDSDSQVFLRRTTSGNWDGMSLSGVATRDGQSLVEVVGRAALAELGITVHQIRSHYALWQEGRLVRLYCQLHQGFGDWSGGLADHYDVNCDTWAELQYLAYYQLDPGLQRTLERADRMGLLVYEKPPQTE